MPKSKLHAVSEEQFRSIVKNALTYADVIRALNLRLEHGPTYRVVKKRIKDLQICTSHFDKTRHLKALHEKQRFTLEEILVEGFEYSSSMLRKRLVKAGLLKYECVSCGNPGEWQGKPLSLQLDHINGNHKDNRLENLRILCPNCHTQTSTHSHGPHQVTPPRYCLRCGCKVHKKSVRCRKCSSEIVLKHKHVTKITWPSKEDLELLIWTHSVEGAAKLLNVSGTAIRKRCLQWDISKPPLGYWAKRKQGGMSHEEALKKTIPKPKKTTRRFTDEEISNILLRLNEGLSCRKIAKAYGVHHSLISSLKRGKTYGNGSHEGTRIP